ncbi:hypothetical protein [Dickeya chrysanthemi]|uniref:hypothetical protein n=1 Tax=Dickeya chrysanthemi TaxID=556 RepID=UPI00058797B5|nr:hypothetical protein [Dickeya chrysanthemi]MBX9447867.1 hypothetical protein [Dickeya chrysanthemi]
MKELFSLVGAVVIWVLVARYLSRMFIKKGHKPWLSKTSGVCVGSVVALAFLVSVVPTSAQNASTQNITAETKPASKPHDGCLEVYKPDGPSEWDCEKKEAPAPAPAPKNIEPAENVAEVKTLDITPDVFAKRMNSNLKKTDVPFRLKVKVQPGEVNNTFNYAFNEHIGIVGSVDKKSGILKNISIITSGDGTDKSGMNVMAVVISAYSAVMGDNTMGTGEPARIMLKLMENYQEEPEKSQSVILNGIKFSFIPSKQIGNWFLAQPL